MVVYRGINEGDGVYVTSKDMITKGAETGKPGLSVTADKAMAATHGTPRQLTSLPKGFKLIHAPSPADPFHCLIVAEDMISRSQFNKIVGLSMFGSPM